MRRRRERTAPGGPWRPAPRLPAAAAALLLLAGCFDDGPSEPGSTAEPAAEQAPTEAAHEATHEAAAAAQIDETDVVMGLPGAPGRDLVLQNCVACHSTALITQNRMTRARWDETLTWMQAKQGLWELPPETRAGILDYLALVQGVQSAGTRPDTPWAEPTYRPNPIW